MPCKFDTTSKLKEIM